MIYKIYHFKVYIPITFNRTVSKRIILYVVQFYSCSKKKLDTKPPIKVSNSVETLSLSAYKNSDNTRNMSYDVHVQLVAIKPYLMNEIYELKLEISQLKDREKAGKCDSSESALTDILKSQICIL